jgi:hypothetical protein
MKTFDKPKLANVSFNDLSQYNTELRASLPTPEPQIQSDWEQEDTNAVDYIKNKPASPKVYRALLTQTGTDAPVATVLENTLGVITFTYIDYGIYNASISDGFSDSKTAIVFGTVCSIGEFGYAYASIDSGVININSFTIRVSEGVLIREGTNDVIKNMSIEILVYP